MTTRREASNLFGDAVRREMFRGWREMFTGRRVTANVVTLEGAPAGKTWVRPSKASWEAIAVLGVASQVDAKVWVGPDINGHDRIYYVSEDTFFDFGDKGHLVLTPPISGKINILEVMGQNFVPGRLISDPDSGPMHVRVEPFVHALGEFDGPSLDLSGYVPATPGTNAWIAVAANPATNTLHAFSGSETWSAINDMLESDARAILLPNGYIPSGAVALNSATTQIDGRTRIIDLRRHIGQVGFPALGDLANVDVYGALDGDRLGFDETLGLWTPMTGGGGGASALGDLSDVDLDTIPPMDGQALVYDLANTQWIPGDVTFDEWELIEQVDLVYRQRIAKITLDAPGSFSFDLAALGAVAAGYDRVYLFARVRGNVAAATDTARIWVNGDKTATNYRTNYHHGGTSHGGALLNYPLFCDMPAGTAPTAHYNMIWGVIEEPFIAGKTKSIRLQTSRIDSTTATYIFDITIERLGSSAVISTLEIVTDNDPTDLFAAGSYIELVGEKYGPISVPVITPQALDDLTDVDLTTPPSDGDVLVYNGTATQWEAAPPAGTHVIKKTFREAELLYDHTFAVAASATPVWALPPGYDSIEIEVAARCDGAVAHTRMGVILNGETLNTNYLWQYHYGSSSAGVQQVNARYAGYIAGTTTTGYNLYTTHKMELRDYASSAIHKHLLNQYSPHASGSYVAVGMASVVWKNIAPVTTIQFDVVEGGYNFLAGSRFKLWGVKSREVVVDGRAADPTPPSPPAQVASFAIAGVVGVGAQPFRIYNAWGSAKTITKVHAAVDIAPQGADLIIDVEKNGTTIFTTQANRPVIAANANTGQSTTIDVATLNEGDYLQFSVDQVGSTTPGSDLVIQVMLE